MKIFISLLILALTFCGCSDIPASGASTVVPAPRAPVLVELFNTSFICKLDGAQGTLELSERGFREDEDAEVQDGAYVASLRIDRDTYEGFWSYAEDKLGVYLVAGDERVADLLIEAAAEMRFARTDVPPRDRTSSPEFEGTIFLEGTWDQDEENGEFFGEQELDAVVEMTVHDIPVGRMLVFQENWKFVDMLEVSVRAQK